MALSSSKQFASKNASHKSTFQLVPWTWQKLRSPKHPRGYIVFHAIDPLTARGLARTATILAYHYQALPMSVRVMAPGETLPKNLFQQEHEEVHLMGYTLATELVPDSDLTDGLITAVEYNDARMVVLAYPAEGRVNDFRIRLNTIAATVHCPVAVIRFLGEVHTERILVPLTGMEDLMNIYPVLPALNAVGEHRLELLYMMSSTAGMDDVLKQKEEVAAWLKEQDPTLYAPLNAIPTASRLEMIKEASEHADLIVMGAPRISRMERFLFGSLVDSVAKQVRKTLIVIYNAEKT